MRLALVLLSLAALAWAQSNYVIAAVAYASAECKSEKCGNIPDCQCAEFAARAIAAGGCIPGLTSTSSKLSYARFMPLGGTWQSYTQSTAYNLAWTSRRNPRGAFNGLYDYLYSVAKWRSVSPAASNLQAGCVIFGDAKLGAWSHACFGVGTDLMACHNKAHCEIKASDLYYRGIDAILCPPESCTGVVAAVTVAASATSRPPPPTTEQAASEGPAAGPGAGAGEGAGSWWSLPPSWTGSSSSSYSSSSSSSTTGRSPPGSALSAAAAAAVAAAALALTTSTAAATTRAVAATTVAVTTTSRPPPTTLPPATTPPPDTTLPPPPPDTTPPPPKTTPPPPKTTPPPPKTTPPPPKTTASTIGVVTVATVGTTTTETTETTETTATSSTTAATTETTATTESTATSTTSTTSATTRTTATTSATVTTGTPKTRPPRTTPPPPETTLPPPPTPAPETTEPQRKTPRPPPTRPPTPAPEPTTPIPVPVTSENGLLTTTGTTGHINSGRAVLATVVGVGLLTTCFLVAAVLAAWISRRKQAGEDQAVSADSAASYSGDNPLFKPLVNNSNPLYADATN